MSGTRLFLTTERKIAKKIRNSGIQGSFFVVLAFLLSSGILQRTNAEASCDQHQRQPGQQQPPDGAAAFAHLQKKEVDCDWIDIREMDLPLCDADKCYGDARFKKTERGH